MQSRFAVVSVCLAWAVLSSPLGAQTPDAAESAAPSLVPPSAHGELPVELQDLSRSAADAPPPPANGSQDLVPPLVRNGPESAPSDLENAEELAGTIPPIVSGDAVRSFLPNATEGDVYEAKAQAATTVAAASSGTSAGFYAGAEALWLRPHFNGSLAGLPTTLAPDGFGLPSLDYDYTVSPRVWLGTQAADGAGLECSFWQFDAAGAGSTITLDGGPVGIAEPGFSELRDVDPGVGANLLAPEWIAPPVQFTTADSMTVQSLYLHATQQWNVGALSLRGGAGLRYAASEQYLMASQLNPAVEGGGPTMITQAWRDFHGLGPSGQLETRRQIGLSRWWGFARAGGAVLFGNRSFAQSYWADVVPMEGGSAFAEAAATETLSSSDSLLGVGELAIGLEWTGRLANGDVLAARGSFEGQRWGFGDSSLYDLTGFAGFAAGLEWRR